MRQPAAVDDRPGGSERQALQHRHMEPLVAMISAAKARLTKQNGASAWPLIRPRSIDAQQDNQAGQAEQQFDNRGLCESCRRHTVSCHRDEARYAVGAVNQSRERERDAHEIPAHRAQEHDHGTHEQQPAGRAVLGPHTRAVRQRDPVCRGKTLWLKKHSCTYQKQQDPGEAEENSGQYQCHAIGPGYRLSFNRYINHNLLQSQMRRGQDCRGLDEALDPTRQTIGEARQRPYWAGRRVLMASMTEGERALDAVWQFASARTNLAGYFLPVRLSLQPANRAPGQTICCGIMLRLQERYVQRWLGWPR